MQTRGKDCLPTLVHLPIGDRMECDISARYISDILLGWVWVHLPPSVITLSRCHCRQWCRCCCRRRQHKDSSRSQSGSKYIK